MSDHQLGTGPIEERYREEMNHMARALDAFLNGDLKGEARTTGFVLLVFPFGEREGRCNYISNGADRRDIIKLLREQANRFDEATQ
jgi:hypothetical protein